MWHGHYIRYFEDGREAFGKAFKLSYLDVYGEGLAIPVVSVQCDYKKPLRYGDTVCVETTYVNTAAAKLVFTYKIYNKETDEVVATGTSTQVFVDVKTFQLHLTLPAFMTLWKQKWKLAL